MKISTEVLLADLIERTKQVLNQAEKLKSYSFQELNWKSGLESWSALECIEHLNLYGAYYLPEIESRIQNSTHSIPETTFKSGFWGNYFSNMILPKEKLNKMKTLKDKNPKGSQLDMATLTRFIDQQKKTLELLSKARKVNLNKTKTSISITNLIKFRLGDTFRFVIYHNQRHLAQTQRALAECNASRIKSQ